MTENVQLADIKLENTYYFSIKHNWKIYENLSIQIDNFKWNLRTIRIWFDEKLKKLTDYKKIESTIFTRLIKSYKKQIRHNNLSFNFR